MDKQIHWLLEVAILPGKLADFKAVADDLIASTQFESGTLAYEWNLNPDETACHIYEAYASSEAVITHAQSFAKFAHRFLEACQPSHFYVYGKPSDAVRKVLADLNPIYFSTHSSISR